MKDYIKRRLAALLMTWGLPVDQYQGAYVYHPGGYVTFPRGAEDRLHLAADVGQHDTLYNLQDDVTIEPGVVLGHRVMFLTGRHEFGPGGVERESATAGAIMVRSRAWIASGAIITGGVEIGEGSVVGAGAVVTKSIPAGELWAGNPARFVRKVSDE